MQQALEALLWEYGWGDPKKPQLAAITALRERLAQPEQEPVWIQPNHLQKARQAPFLCRVEPAKRDDFVPLYTTPPQRQWQGLTDDEINSVCYKRDWTAPWTDTTFARAIEAKLREKNT